MWGAHSCPPLSCAVTRFGKRQYCKRGARPLAGLGPTVSFPPPRVYNEDSGRGGLSWLFLLHRRGDGFSGNFTAGNAADSKPTALALAVSLKSVCCLYLCCSRCAACSASTAAMFSVPSRSSSARDFLQSCCKLRRPPTPRPATALHKFPRPVYTWLKYPGRQSLCLPGCGRPSSAVLGFEYGLPRAKQRTIGSPAGQSALLLVSFLRFFPPTAVSVVSL